MPGEQIVEEILEIAEPFLEEASEEIVAEGQRLAQAFADILAGTILWNSKKASDEKIAELEKQKADAIKSIPKAQDETKQCSTKNCDEKEPCPICGRGVNPVKGKRPGYLDAIPPRCPKDWETNPPLSLLKRVANKRVHGAQVYESPDGNYYHVDTFHKGRASEIEVYDRRGNHLGAICPNCGMPIPDSKVKGRSLPK